MQFYNKSHDLPTSSSTVKGTDRVTACSISLARNGLLYGKSSLHWSYFVWIAVLLVLAVVGTRLIYRNENTYVKVI